MTMITQRTFYFGHALYRQQYFVGLTENMNLDIWECVLDSGQAKEPGCQGMIMILLEGNTTLGFPPSN
jgi:hypothetical protein